MSRKGARRDAAWTPTSRGKVLSPRVKRERQAARALAELDGVATNWETAGLGLSGIAADEVGALTARFTAAAATLEKLTYRPIAMSNGRAAAVAKTAPAAAVAAAHRLTRATETRWRHLKELAECRGALSKLRDQADALLKRIDSVDERCILDDVVATSLYAVVEEASRPTRRTQGQNLPNPLALLPDELWLIIFAFVGPVSVKGLQYAVPQVCRLWRRLWSSAKVQRKWRLWPNLPRLVVVPISRSAMTPIVPEGLGQFPINQRWMIGNIDYQAVLPSGRVMASWGGRTSTISFDKYEWQPIEGKPGSRRAVSTGRNTFCIKMAVPHWSKITPSITTDAVRVALRYHHTIHTYEVSPAASVSTGQLALEETPSFMHITPRGWLLIGTKFSWDGTNWMHVYDHSMTRVAAVPGRWLNISGVHITDTLVVLNVVGSRMTNNKLAVFDLTAGSVRVIWIESHPSHRDDWAWEHATMVVARDGPERLLLIRAVKNGAKMRVWMTPINPDNLAANIQWRLYAVVDMPAELDSCTFQHWTNAHGRLCMAVKYDDGHTYLDKMLVEFSK